jgi:hypothetical protein
MSLENHLELGKTYEKDRPAPGSARPGTKAGRIIGIVTKSSTAFTHELKAVLAK